MNKTARIKLCNKLSPDRFDKTAGMLGNFFRQGWSKLRGAGKAIGNALTQTAPVSDVQPGTGFLSNALKGFTAFYNPKNAINAFKYGPGTFLQEVKDVALNTKAWKEAPFSNALNTYFSALGPYFAITTALEDSPTQDTEGTVERGMRRVFNVIDLADMSGKVMAAQSGNPWSFFPGLIFGRYILRPTIGKAIDKFLGTGPTKEVIQQRFSDRFNKELPDFIKNNPNIDPQEARYSVLQNILGQYDQTSLEKLFS